MNRAARRRAAATGRRPSVIRPAVSGDSLLAAIPRPLVARVFEMAREIEAAADPALLLVVDLDVEAVRTVHALEAPADLFAHVVAAGAEAHERGGVALLVTRGGRVEAGVLGGLIPHAGAA